jgi:hypothetical protein
LCKRSYSGWKIFPFFVLLLFIHTDLHIITWIKLADKCLTTRWGEVFLLSFSLFHSLRHSYFNSFFYLSFFFRDFLLYFVFISIVWFIIPSFIQCIFIYSVFLKSFLLFLLVNLRLIQYFFPSYFLPSAACFDFPSFLSFTHFLVSVQISFFSLSCLS